MFLFISRYEWLLLKANKMLLLLGGILAFIMFFALYEGHKRVSFQKETLHQIEQQEKADYAKYRSQIAGAQPGQHFDGGHFGDPTNPFYFGNRMGAKYAVLRPSALSILSTGQNDIYPYYYKVTLSKKQALYHNEELENPQILFNGRFDVSFVIIFLLPLLIISFTYNIYSSEKENGTLSLLMAQGTSIDKIIAFRFVFRYLLFNSFFTSLLLVGLLGFGVDIGSDISSLAAAIGITWFYTAFWFILSYWINSKKKTSGFSATVLTGTWLFLVLIIPTIISALIDVIHPLPSRLELITQSRNFSDSLAKNKGIVSRFFEEHPEFKPAIADPKDRNALHLRTRIAVEMAMERKKSEFDAVVEKRERVVTRYRFLSPAIFIQLSLNNIAGTSDSRYKSFDKQVAGYQQAFRDYFEPLVYRKERFTAAHLDGVPKFTYQHVHSDAPANEFFIQDKTFLAVLLISMLLLILLKPFVYYKQAFMKQMRRFA